MKLYEFGVFGELGEFGELTIHMKFDGMLLISYPFPHARIHTCRTKTYLPKTKQNSPHSYVFFISKIHTVEQGINLV